MGIKFFYKWLSQNFGQHIKHINAGKSDVAIDVLLVDMNGLFHNSAQRVFKYGNCAQKSLLRKIEHVKFNNKTQLACFEDVAKSIERIVTVVHPTTTLVLAVDGVAPASKINQQRQRRFRGSLESTLTAVDRFDSISITPGTKFMDQLSKYIDWYIRKRMTESDLWRNLKVVFSSEKCPGEGEHKLVDYIRKYGRDDATYCINALDADLVMLSLATMKPNFYLLRDEQNKGSSKSEFSLVSIGGLRTELQKSVMFWEGSNPKLLIKDFILVCFLCGNDFLPNIPSISIIENSLDVIIKVYKQVCGDARSHLVDDANCIHLRIFQQFLHSIGTREQGILVQKAINKNDCFPNPMLEEHTNTTILNIIERSDGVSEGVSETSTDQLIVDVDMVGYKEAYYNKKGLGDIRAVCHSYISGCQWVLTYYLAGVKDWSWVYPYNYSPFALEIADHVSSYTPTKIVSTRPISPFEQLLCVVPPKSANLLPSPLGALLKSGKFKPFCPDTFVINCEGKKYEYEGVVELPIADISFVKRECNVLMSRIDLEDAKRNDVGQTLVYTNGEFRTNVRSCYGEIRNCDVETMVLV